MVIWCCIPSHLTLRLQQQAICSQLQLHPIHPTSQLVPAVWKCLQSAAAAKKTKTKTAAAKKLNKNKTAETVAK